MAALLATYGKPLGLAAGLAAAWLGSLLLAQDPPRAAAKRAASVPAPSATGRAAPATAASGPKKAKAYVEGPVVGGGSVRVRCVLTKPFEIVDLPLNKDQGPSKCGHDRLPNERALHDPEHLTLANCVVWIDGIEQGKAFEGALATPAPEVVVDQKGCRYVPHVQIVRRGARLAIKNSDPVEHNIQGFHRTKGSQVFNVMSSSLSLISPSDDTTLGKTEQYILGCSIHPWMSGYLWSAPHPYHGVTGLDGTVLLTDVPAGTHTVACWHEGMRVIVQTKGAEISGYEFSNDLVPPPQTVTVSAGQTVEVTFTIEPR